MVKEITYKTLNWFILLGGGFFVRYHGLWALRGLVSSGTLRDHGGCDVDRFTLFTNVLDFTSWIDDVIRKNAASSEKQSNFFCFYFKYLF